MSWLTLDCCAKVLVLNGFLPIVRLTPCYAVHSIPFSTNNPMPVGMYHTASRAVVWMPFILGLAPPSDQLQTQRLRYHAQGTAEAAGTGVCGRGQSIAKQGDGG